MTEALFNDVQKIVEAALLEQDACTYNGISTNCTQAATDATKKILERVDKDAPTQYKIKHKSPVWYYLAGRVRLALSRPDRDTIPQSLVVEQTTDQIMAIVNEDARVEFTPLTRTTPEHPNSI